MPYCERSLWVYKMQETQFILTDMEVKNSTIPQIVGLLEERHSIPYRNILCN